MRSLAREESEESPEESDLKKLTSVTARGRPRSKRSGLAIRHFQHSEASIRPFRPAQEWKWRRTRLPRQISECCGCREASGCIALAERFQEL